MFENVRVPPGIQRSFMAIVLFEHSHIQNVNTIDERRSKIARNKAFDCHLSPYWRQMAIKNLFLTIFDPRCSIVRAFSFAAYPM